MEDLKLVEKLKDKANISYEEAKEILEANNWDILDAIIYLEENQKKNKEEFSNDEEKIFININSIIVIINTK